MTATFGAAQAKLTIKPQALAAELLSLQASGWKHGLPAKHGTTELP